MRSSPGRRKIGDVGGFQETLPRQPVTAYIDTHYNGRMTRDPFCFRSLQFAAPAQGRLSRQGFHLSSRAVLSG
jgi:hypothetical protein